MDCSILTNIFNKKKRFRNISLIIFILLTLVAIGKRDIEIVNKEGNFYSANLQWRVIEPIRQKLSDMTNRSRNREFLKALTTGKREFSGKFRSLLINSGTMHLVAISAFHVGVVFIILNLIFFRFIIVFIPIRPSRNYLLTLLFKLIFSVYYFFITGGSIPTLRAISFILIFEFITFFGRLPNPMVVFLISLFTVSVAIPASALSLSFLMSAICVATVLNVWKNIPDSVTIRLISISVIINYALLPVTCSLNGCLSLSAPFINFLIIPLMFLIIPVISLAQFCIIFSEDIAQFFLRIADILLDPIMFNLNFFSNYSDRTLFPIIEPVLFIKIAFAITFFLALLLKGTFKKSIVFLNFILFFFFLFNFSSNSEFKRPREFFSKIGCVVKRNGSGSIIFDKYKRNPRFNNYFYNNLERSSAQCGITEVSSIHFPKQVPDKIKERIKNRLRFRDCKFYLKGSTDHPEKNQHDKQALRFSDPFL